ncbi:hypothetical protein OFM39_29460, partial [Escherichia coli]|nr:hypothetical protein [Escherichia coli]
KKKKKKELEGFLGDLLGNFLLHFRREERDPKIACGLKETRQGKAKQARRDCYCSETILYSILANVTKVHNKCHHLRAIPFVL